MRMAIAFALLLFTAFCVYGFIASGEPGPNHIYYRIGYPLAGMIALAAAVSFIMTKHRPP
jgi:hypothetical protein